MASTKSRPHKTRMAPEPQRRNGKLRVASILKAGTDVIAEKGYEAATMAEIAIRSDTQVGSLYRFFPNKESLANAMMARYCANIDIVFDKIDAAIASLSISDLADMLLDTILELHQDGAAVIRLIEAHKVWSFKREELRKAALQRIARTLILSNSKLSPGLAKSMAFVILGNMKAMNALSSMDDKKTKSRAIKELRTMTQLYLKDRLKRM